MEPVGWREPFSDPGFAFQVKWDGVRILALVGDEVILQNRNLRARTEQYPEIVEVLEKLFKGRGVVLDGEMVVLDREGKPSFSRILRRDLAADRVTVRRLRKEIPVVYTIFDILYDGHQDLCREPWTNRQETLREVLPEADNLHLTENFPDGKRLFAAVRRQELEGMVAKRRDSPYLPGVKSGYWRKVKARRSLLCTIGGFTERLGRVASLLVGAYDQDRLLYLGRVSSGLTEAQRHELGSYLPGLSRETPPFINPPRRTDMSPVWVEPRLCAVVEFSEWTEGLKMRAPVLVGFTRDRPTDCIL